MTLEELVQQGYSRRSALKLLAISAAVASAASIPAFAQAPANRGGVLKLATIGSSSTEPLDPIAVTGGRTISFILWDRLTWVDSEQKVQPELATSWTFTPDLKTWTFELRKDVTFHNGKTLTAKDVVYTFSRILDPKKGGQAFTSFTPFLNPDSVVAKDDYTVVFNLKAPLFDLDALLAGDQIAIMPDGVSDEEIRAKGLGTGPFVLKEYSPTSHLIVTRNPNYWRKGYPLLDGIELYKVLDAAQRSAGLLSGQFDLITDLTPLASRQLASLPAFQVSSVPSGNVVVLFMLGTAKPFDDNRVRTALKMALDRDRIVKQVYLGEALIANDQPIPPFSPLSSKIPPIPRNIEGAKKLLAEAGFPNGIDLTLHTSSTGLGDVPGMAVAVADTVKDAGIRIKVQQEPSATYISNYLKGAFPFWNVGYGMRVDALLVDILYAPSPLSKEGRSRYGWKNDEFAAKYKAALAEPDATKRKALFGEVETILRDDGNILIPAYFNVIEAYSKRLQNYKPHSTSYWRQYWNLSITK